MKSAQIEKTNSRAVSCNGIKSPYGHPKVYLEIDPKEDYINCPYCSKRFEYKGE